MSPWQPLNQAIVQCERCTRLRAYCREVAEKKRRAFQDWPYWGQPVPNFGDAQARMLIVGLAPAAHGANRTGRMFTGDRSGDWLYRALHKAGFANRAASHHRDDGLRLKGCAITAVCHCAPPANKPLPAEIGNCRAWLVQTIDGLPVKVFVALGQVAWRAVFQQAKARAWIAGPMPKFRHAAVAAFGAKRWLVGSYHPSQQNTFTGRLTEAMFDAVFVKAAALLREYE